jgi:hypothetical protein
MPTCHGVGWPTTCANAAPALASSTAAVAAMAAKGENKDENKGDDTFICLFSSLL